MKRLFIFTFSMILLSCAVSFSSCADRETTAAWSDPFSWVETQVMTGAIQSAYTVSGTVVETDDAVRTCTVSLDPADEELVRSLYGRTFHEGDSIYGGMTAEQQERIVGILFGEGTVSLTLLAENKLKVRTVVDRQHFDQITYLTEVSVSSRGSSFDASVYSVDYHLSGDQAEVTVRCSGENLLPGETVSVRFVLGTREGCPYVIQEAVAYDVMGNAYLYVRQSDGEYVKRTVMTGEVFTVEDAGYLRTYTEIVSGAEPGDRIRYQAVKDNPATHIYEEFLQ